MPRIIRSALVNFSAEQMFELVNDVDAYSLFLPGCSGSRVIDVSENTMTASVDVSKAGISKTFTTRNKWVRGEVITMELLNGPFRKLQGSWSFRALDENKCKVELNLDFEFSNVFIEIAFGQIFNEVVGNMVNAFTQRAKVIYV